MRLPYRRPRGSGDGPRRAAMGPRRRTPGRRRFAASAALVVVSLWTLLRPAAAAHNCTYGPGPTLSSAILYERLAFDIELGVVSCRGNVAAVGTVLSDIVELTAAVPTRDALFPQESQQGGLNGLLFVNGLMNGIGARDFAVSAWIWPHIGPGEDRAYLIDAYGPGGFNDLRFTMGVGFGVLEAAVWTGSSLQGGNSGQAVEVAGLSSVPKWIHVAVTRTGTELNFYINGRDTGTGAEVQAVGDFSDIANITIGTQRIGVASANRWLGQVDDIRVYVGTVSASEIYGIFRASHSAYNAMQQVGFSSFNMTYPAAPDGDTKMHLGFNATYDRTDYSLTPSLGTTTGPPAVLGDDVTFTGPLRGFGISMLTLLTDDQAFPFGGFENVHNAWVFTTGPSPSRIRTFRFIMWPASNSYSSITCDYLLVEAPGGVPAGDTMTQYLAKDPAVRIPSFEAPMFGYTRPEFGRNLLPQITSYVMQPSTTYAITAQSCDKGVIYVMLSMGAAASFTVLGNGFQTLPGMRNDGPGDYWRNLGMQDNMWPFDLEVETPAFQAADAALDGTSMTVANSKPVTTAFYVATSFIVGTSNLRLDSFTITMGSPPAVPGSQGFTCTVELYRGTTTGQPGEPTGAALATGSVRRKDYADTTSVFSFQAPEALAAVTLRKGQRYAFKFGPCDTDGLSWAYSESGAPAGSPSAEPGTSFAYEPEITSWVPVAGDFIWTASFSKEPAGTTETVTGSMSVAVPQAGCGAVGTYGLKFTPSCDAPCPELPAFQIDAAVAEPDGWCRENATSSTSFDAPTATSSVAEPDPRYPGDYAVWAIRVRTSADMRRVLIRNGTLLLPDRPEGDPWRSRALRTTEGGFTPLGTAASFGTVPVVLDRPTVLYDPTVCMSGPDPGMDTGPYCSQAGFLVTVGNDPAAYVLEDGVDTGLTRVALEVFLAVQYWDEPIPARRRRRRAQVEHVLAVRLETTVRMGRPVTGRKLRVHGA
ncbi:hypothetical protein DFJ74DRAFT_689257 [Hyaloraphidium curvatum]|nr:hypothetical protein DFJ74DRAFT_689257 [Hyaloraphidium curvatum]